MAQWETAGARGRIAIVSVAGHFPDAPSVKALWTNVLEGRRAFRTIPAERLDIEGYNRSGRASLGIVPVKAGLLTNWHFNRAHFRVSGACYESTDLAHWLALDVAHRALDTLGGAQALDRSRTAVIVANTLTGEFSRAAALALRAPFMDELLEAASQSIGLEGARTAELRATFLNLLLERLPEPNEDTLAGGLANTIAGRIANFCDFKGGAFTVDAACASSLVALSQACDALVSERASAVLVGAVDLSLDPFELVGFSRVGALATNEMRVFDTHSNGFWPGEGAGFAVLMLEDEARRAGFEVLATLRGWGISTDGAGGLIRPTVAGQILAIERACCLGNVDPADLDFVEAHGTGTPTGDPVEVRALATLRGASSRSLPIGSIKANIGHTKAAAGFAGLLKTVEALRHGIVPPHVSVNEPHPVFAEVEGCVRVAHVPELFGDTRAALAGVSSFGFGGVNAHVLLEGPALRYSPFRTALPAVSPHQDAELFLFAAESKTDLISLLNRLRRRCATLGWSELADCAAQLAIELAPGSYRAAVVARYPDELAIRLDLMLEAAFVGDELFSPSQGVFCAARKHAPRIGYLFPGQAAPVRLDGGSWRKRFGASILLPPAPASFTAGETLGTAVAQPAIVAASIAAIEQLQRAGITASVALGHSLGELTALAWGGALDLRDAVALAAARGLACSDHAVPGGVMVRIAADATTTRGLAAGLDLVVACENAPEETIVSGTIAAAAKFQRLAHKAGYESVQLAVSHAFHSRQMEAAIMPWQRCLKGSPLRPPTRRLVSSITGNFLTEATDLTALLARQLTDPVLFMSGLACLQGEVDLVIEAGPGRGMARLANAAGLRAVSTDAFGDSIAPFLEALAAAFVIGAPVDPGVLTRDRRMRAMDLDQAPSLLSNPCGRKNPASAPRHTAMPPPAFVADESPVFAGTGGTLDLVRIIVANELRLDLASVGPDDRFDVILHLESLAVARIVARAARGAGAPVPRAPTEFASATARILADALDELRDMPGAVLRFGERIDGVRPWVRQYGMMWKQAPRSELAAPLQWRHCISGEDCSSVSETALAIHTKAVIRTTDATGLLKTIQQAIANPAIRHIALINADAPISAFARCIALEGWFDSVRLIHQETREDASLASELLARVSGFSEIRLQPDGDRCAPAFVPIMLRQRKARRVSCADVVLVTGGARGIAAEAALQLGRSTGCALILCGRSAPDIPDVLALLQRAKASGVRALYIQGNVLDAASLKAAVAPATSAFGCITVLLHAPGVNTPKKFDALTPEILQQTLGPKACGLENALLAAGNTLSRVYTFGSIIGRIGLAGEAHYALANAWQTALLARYAETHPDCLTLSLEWSVWGGIGMGEQLGVLERLSAQGVDALETEQALLAFERLVLDAADGVAAVTSRFGAPPSLDLGPGALAPLRFVDKPLVHFPGVELIVETTLWAGRDPCLADHRIQGSMLLPGVMALEAMAQVASQLLPEAQTVAETSDISFARAIVVADGSSLAIRIGCLRHPDGRVEACVRTADDGYVADCARATFRFGACQPDHSQQHATPVRLCAAAPLYGPLFFHGARFQRLDFYRIATSRAIAARIAPARPGSWFGALDLPTLLLGDPGARDAALHALQAAIPFRQVAPVSVGRIVSHSAGTPVEITAQETSAGKDRYIFDIQLQDAAGARVESWHDVCFCGIGKLDEATVLGASPELACAYIERLARELLDDSIAVVLGPSSRASILDRLGFANLAARSDGNPEAAVSFSHGGIGMGVCASQRIGCDMEQLATLAADPAPPPLAFMADGSSIAAGQAWVAGEALRKLGRRPPHRLALAPECRMLAAYTLFEAQDASILVSRLTFADHDLLVAIAIDTASPLDQHVRQKIGEVAA